MPVMNDCRQSLIHCKLRRMLLRARYSFQIVLPCVPWYVLRTLTGPRVLYAAIEVAVMKPMCVSYSSGEVITTQEFSFKLE